MKEEGRAVGVELKSGRTVRARQAVVSNASVWDTVVGRCRLTLSNPRRNRLELSL